MSRFSLAGQIKARVKHLIRRSEQPPLEQYWSADEPVIEPPHAPSAEEAQKLVQSFNFWYHRIYLGHGVYTLPQAPAFPELVWHRFRAAFPPSLNGASVLDVGCNAGYFSIQTKLRGAGRVVGVESIGEYLRQAEICRQIWDMDIEYLALDAHHLATLREQFDLVVFAGILYHLKNPLQVLETVGALCRDAILVETEVLPPTRPHLVYARQGGFGQTEVVPCTGGIMKFVERDELNGDGSNWWIPDTECLRGMLRTAGFNYFSAPYYSAEYRVLMIASKKAGSILSLAAF